MQDYRFQDRRLTRHWPFRNRWLIVKARWSDLTWRDRWADLRYLIGR